MTSTAVATTADTADALRIVDEALASGDIERMRSAVSRCAGALLARPGPARQRLRRCAHEVRVADVRAAREGGNAAAEKGSTASAAAQLPPSPFASSAPGGGGYDVARFAGLTAKAPKLKWRLESKPGGATLKPDAFYLLTALAAQARRPLSPSASSLPSSSVRTLIFFFPPFPSFAPASPPLPPPLFSFRPTYPPRALSSTPPAPPLQAANGDDPSERPMWAEKGGLDFEGRALWDARASLRGKGPAECKALYVKTYWEASPACFYSDERSAEDGAAAADVNAAVAGGPTAVAAK